MVNDPFLSIETGDAHETASSSTEVIALVEETHHSQPFERRRP